MSGSSARERQHTGESGGRVHGEMENYELLSLETHLFFARTMKEHAIFLEAGFSGKNADYIRQADWFKSGFEGILSQAAELGCGIVSGKVLRSGELFTDYTLDAEEQTTFLTGIGINRRITQRERQMASGCGRIPCSFSAQVEKLNERALHLLDGLIAFKENVLKEVSECNMFTANYPLLLKHIIREAKRYRSLIRNLQGEEDDLCCELRAYECREDDCSDAPAMETFWNRIMLEHALFIRGSLDPSEGELIRTANEFAKAYEELLAETGAEADMAAKLTERTREETEKYRDFKAAGAKGITECQISSIILPLLADHVLREANHYLRLLEKTSAFGPGFKA